MNLQTEIDFTTVLHAKENNSYSQKVLEDNYFHLTGQCAVVLSLLRQGHRLTVYEATVKHGISHLPRRIKDLTDAGADIKKAPVIRNGKPTRYIEYFMEPNPTTNDKSTHRQQA